MTSSLVKVTLRDLGHAQTSGVRHLAVRNFLHGTFSDSSGSAALRQSGSLGTFSEYYPNGEDCDESDRYSGSVERSAA